MGFFGPELKYALTLACGAVSIGMILSFASPAGFSFYNEMCFNGTRKDAFNALPSISAIAGSPLLNLLVYKYGRKVATIGAQAGIVIGWILLIVCGKSYSWLSFIARLISGISMGGASGIIPAYIGEIAPDDAKGSFGVMNQLAVSFGALLEYVFGIFAEWRLIAILSLIPCLIFFIFIWFCPDSKSDIQKNEEESVEDSTEEKRSESKETDHSFSSGAKKLFQMNQITNIIICILAVFFQQFSGINALLTNLNNIFEQSNIELDPSVASVIVGAAQVISNILATPFVGFCGNKICWSISAGGQALFLLLAWANEQWDLSKSIPIICLFFDVLLFGLGLGPMPWYVVVELFSGELGSLASSLNQGLNWILCSVMIFAFQPMVNSMTIGWVYFFYGVIMIISMFYGVFLMPGRADKSNSENKCEV